MASIRASLNFSSQSALSYPFSLDAILSAKVDSGHTIRTKVLGTAQGSDAVTVSKANDKTDVAYVYVRNLSPEKEKKITLYVGTTNIAMIGGGEFAFIPAAPDIDFKVFATKAGQLMEYAVFGLDDTQAKLG
tara:strand:- start:74 stop:469 length:396 start_codon:yes stop_codon:yes gene_type:complete